MIDQLLKKTGLGLDNTSAPLVTETVTFQKGDCLTTIGEVENYIYLIVSGGVKVSYFVEIKEYILDFWFQGDFFSSYVSFIERTPALTQITAISETKVERIDYHQLQATYKASHLGSEIGRRMAELMYIHKTKKEIELISLTAEQRYKKLLEESKNLILEVPVKDIASYLGIEPESLSRIRRKINT